MLKKFFIVLVLFISFIGISFGAGEKQELEKLQEEFSKVEKAYNISVKELKAKLQKEKANGTITEEEINKKIEDTFKETKEILKDYKIKIREAKIKYNNSIESRDDFGSAGFKLPVFNLFPGNRYGKSDSYTGNIKDFLMDLIQKMMVGLGAISLIIIVIGSSFMILYHGEESMITKGKSIFSGGIIALIVALSSYYLIEIIKYLIALN